MLSPLARTPYFGTSDKKRPLPEATDTTTTKKSKVESKEQQIEAEPPLVCPTAPSAQTLAAGAMDPQYTFSELDHDLFCLSAPPQSPNPFDQDLDPEDRSIVDENKERHINFSFQDLFKK